MAMRQTALAMVTTNNGYKSVIGNVFIDFRISDSHFR